MSHEPSPSEDFDAAKEMVDKLAPLPAERQTRIVRWVTEALGLAPIGSGHVPVPSAIHAATPVPAASIGAPGSSKDIKTFITEKAPRSDNQFAATVAYYYRFEAPPASRKDSIDGTTLQEAARLAGWRRPKRPTDTLHNARKSGYLDSAERGTFRLNSVGENLVAMAMPGGDGTGAVKPHRKRSPAKKRAGAKTR